MSAIEQGLYTKPNPDCGRCKGTGTRKVRTVMPPLFGTGQGTETRTIRCQCTDARNRGTMEARTAQDAE